MGRKKKRFYPEEARSFVDTNVLVVDSSKKNKRREPASESCKKNGKRQKEYERLLKVKDRHTARVALLEQLEKSCVTSDLLIATKHKDLKASSGNKNGRWDKLESDESEQESGTSPSPSHEYSNNYHQIEQPFDNCSDESSVDQSDDSSDLDFFASASDLFPARVSPCYFERRSSIQLARSSLPIIGYEQEIMEAVRNEDFLLLTGATGSGKTTQVPQFALEAGYGKGDSETPGRIVVTEPRRIAAISTANRVSDELGDSSITGYQVRHDRNNWSDKARLLFVTDGILLRMVASDFCLSDCSMVVLDEAHDRTISTDLLLGLLTKIVPLRREMWKAGENFPFKDRPAYPLKVIVMSATLGVDQLLDNKKLFPTKVPRSLSVEGRVFNVSIHFAKETPTDYVRAAYYKILEICKENSNDRDGGILVFLPGRQEIHRLCRMLKDEPIEDPQTEGSFSDFDDFTSDRELEDHSISRSPLEKIVVLPLYAALPAASQMRVFQEVPPDHRLIVVSTNIAETSVTLPTIKYVVDSGKARERKYLPGSQISKYQVSWASKASAIQRSGRAGRVSSGHCWRLYSAAVWEREFKDHSIPEMQRTPVDFVVLTMKSIGIVNVLSFPFPSAPDSKILAEAEKLLYQLGAIDSDNGTGGISPIGRLMGKLPIHPRLSRSLLEIVKISEIALVGIDAISIIAATVDSDLFIRELAQDSNVIRTMKHFGATECTADWAIGVRILHCWRSYTGNKEKFCADWSVDNRALQEADLVSLQLKSVLKNLENFKMAQCEYFDASVEISINKCLATAYSKNIAILTRAHGESAYFCDSIRDAEGNPKVLRVDLKSFLSIRNRKLCIAPQRLIFMQAHETASEQVVVSGIASLNL